MAFRRKTKQKSKPVAAKPAVPARAESAPTASAFGDPFREITRLRREMDRFFHQFAGAGIGAESWPTFSLEPPSLDVYEEGDDVVVKAEMPGLERKDIDVSLEGNVLTLKGEKKKEEEVRESDYHRRERTYGSFSRGVLLPAEIEPDNVKASFKNGVLTMRLPKSAAAKRRSRRIEVR